MPVTNKKVSSVNYDEDASEFDPLYDSDAEDFVWEEYDTNKIFRSERPSHVVPTSLNDSSIRLTPVQYRSAVDQIINDYFENEDITETRHHLKALDSYNYHDEFVYRTLSFALDSEDFNLIKLSSSLLTYLCTSQTITSHQIIIALERIMELIHTYPNSAPDFIAYFIDFSIIDGILSDTYRYRLAETFLNKVSPSLFEELPIYNTVLNTLREYKKNLIHAVRDVIEGGDEEETILILKDILKDEPSMHHEFVRRLLQVSFERTDRIRETVSVRLSSLCNSVLSHEDIHFGFLRTLCNITDIKYDAPKSDDYLCSFILRAIVDDILPPSFVSESLRMRLGRSSGRRLVRKAQRHLQRSGLCLCTRYRKVWTAEDVTSSEYTKFKENIKNILHQIFNSNDLNTIVDKISNLEMSPKQAGELVRKIIVSSMSYGDKGRDIAIQMFALLTVKELSEEDFQLGFAESWRQIKDIQLDNPNAEEELIFFEKALIEEGILPKRFKVRLD